MKKVTYYFLIFETSSHVLYLESRNIQKYKKIDQTNIIHVAYNCFQKLQTAEHMCYIKISLIDINVIIL